MENNDNFVNVMFQLGKTLCNSLVRIYNCKFIGDKPSQNKNATFEKKDSHI